MSPISRVKPIPVVVAAAANDCETETVQPLSNSPEPLNDRVLFNPHLEPSDPKVHAHQYAAVPIRPLEHQCLLRKSS